MEYANELTKEFYIEGKKETGLLLTHAFLFTPAVMLPMAELLKPAGYGMYGIRLSGHGTSYEDLFSVKYQDWMEDMQKGYRFLKEQGYQNIYVLGLSLGAALSIDLAARNQDIKGIISLASPMIPRTALYQLAFLTKHFKKTRTEKNVSIPVRDREYRYFYTTVPMAAYDEAYQFMKVLKKSVEKVTQPILIFQSDTDSMVTMENADYIYAHVASRKKELIRLHKGGHILTLSRHNKEIGEKVIAFIDGVQKENM